MQQCACVSPSIPVRPTPSSPLGYPYVCCLCLCLSFCFANSFICTIFLYVLINGIFFSLSDLLYSVWQSLSPPTSLHMEQCYSFSWLSNIPLCISVTSSLSITLVMDIFSCSGCSKQCFSEHWRMAIFLNYGFLWVYTQKRDFWVTWYFCF